MMMMMRIVTKVRIHLEKLASMMEWMRCVMPFIYTCVVVMRFRHLPGSLVVVIRSDR